MKKLLNDPQLYVEQMLEGLVLAHPQYYERAGDGGRVIKRPGPPQARQGRHRLRRRLRPSADLHRLCRQGAAGRLRHRRGVLLAVGRSDGGGDARGQWRRRRAAPLRQLRRRPHELRHGRRHAGDGGRAFHHRAAGRRCRQRAAGGGGEAARRGRHGVRLQDGRCRGRGRRRSRRGDARSRRRRQTRCAPSARR